MPVDRMSVEEICSSFFTSLCSEKTWENSAACASLSRMEN
jgi:hypothetical protein